MVFNSPLFLFLFLPLALLLHLIMPARLRNGFLLLASLIFYAWGDAWSVPVLLLAVFGNYFLGLAVERSRSGQPGRSGVLALGVALNLGLLVYFKYLKFAVQNLAALGALDPGVVDFSGWHLPLGVSFFTFGHISYLVDIHRGTSRAERDPVDFSLYATMFPKIAAGPIARYSDLSAQLKHRSVTLDGFAGGVRRFVVGLAKKVLIAAPVGAAADEVFRMAGLDAPTAWLGLLCYTLQIYFDFSGYTDMAVGLGRMFGFVMPENFDYPYSARSVQEFWRRWHISLSTWFRDYLYIPLGGGRVSPARVYSNLVIVFLLCGLWHGASWSFVVWGLWHGLFLALERAGLGQALQRVPAFFRHAYLILAVSVGWVFFRAEDLSGAWGYLRTMVTPGWSSFEYFSMTFVTRELLTILALGVLGSFPLVPFLRDRAARLGLDAPLAAAAVLALLAASALQLAASTFTPFIYAKF